MGAWGNDGGSVAQEPCPGIQHRSIPLGRPGQDHNDGPPTAFPGQVDKRMA